MIVKTFCSVWTYFASMLLTYDTPSEISVDFRIYNPGIPTFTEFTINSTDYDNDNTDYLTNLNLSPKKNYLVLAAGWEDGFDSIFYTNVVNEFYTHDNTIIITAGYEKFMRLTYCISLTYIEDMGKRISKLIIDLMTKIQIPPEKIELAGHSLGAHISGIAGQRIFRKTGKKIKRIFGLDPASPSIPYNQLQLTNEDAERVIIIHTSLLGLQESIGHVDFYPNGGLFQWKCGLLNENSHMVAIYYFYTSINYKVSYTAQKCSSYFRYITNKCNTNETALMGYHVEDTAEGNYYIDISC